MRKKHTVRVISGKYKGMRGWTYDLSPNDWGNIMFYSTQGSYPYRVCLSHKDIEYLKVEE